MMFRVVCFSLLLTLITGLELKSQLHSHWQKFKSAHQKSYTPGEEERRKEVFKQNVEQILKHNIESDLGLQSIRLGVNEFADMTHEEFKSRMFGLNPVNETEGAERAIVSSRANDLPKSVDWREYVGPVKNQGSCGSCWSFAATGSVEAMTAIYTGKRISLSEQELIDCAGEDSAYRNHGCNGGNPLFAFRYIRDNGIASDTCYQYEHQDNVCRASQNCKTGTVTKFVSGDYGDENGLLQAVATRGPVAIGFNAGQRDFQLYKTGIYNNSACPKKVNHAVLAVGYGTEDGQDYWLIKNSWGPSWGDKGYFKMARGINRCGVANMVSYPII